MRSQIMKTLLLFLPLAIALVAAPADRDNTVIVPSLKGLVFVASPKDVQKSGLTIPGVSLAGVPTLNQAAFHQELTSYLGRPLTFKGLTEITSKVSAFYKRLNH